MKEVWKRILSLALCAVLLVSNVPVQALATEGETTETQAAAPQPTEPAPTESAPAEPAETQPAPTDSQPIPGEGSTASAEAANNGEEDIVEYNILVDNVMLTSKNSSVNNITYSVTDGILTLNGANVTSLEIKDGANIAKVCLVDGTINKIAGKIQWNGDLTISGKGSLEVKQIDLDDKTLTIEGAAVYANAVDGENPNNSLENAVIAKNVVLNDAVHFRAVAKTIAVQLAPDGKIIRNGEFVQASEQTTGESVEFISASHGSVKKISDEEHAWVCNDLKEGTPCPLRKVINSEAHKEETAATCLEEAKCSVCQTAYGGIKADAHTTEETKYVMDSDNDTHQLVHSCCGKADEEAEKHEWVFDANGATITEACSVCKKVRGTITLAAPENLVWDGSEKKVTVQQTFAENKEVEAPTYYQIGLERAEMELESAPVAPGEYVAKVTYNSKTASLPVTIQAKTITADMVTVSPDNKDYSGSKIAEPTVIVKDGEVDITKQCEVEFYRGEKKLSEDEDYINAGTITIKVTGKENYTGTATKTFTINPIAPVASNFDFKAPGTEGEKLIYDGSPKEATVRAKNNIVGMGTVTKKYYKGGTLLDSAPVDAGAYTVKINVAAGQNYTEGKDLTADGWNFTISKSTTELTGDKDRTVTFLKGDDSITLTDPVFTGEKGETVTGVYAYKMNCTTDKNEIIRQMKAASVGELIISYTFTPDNYEEKIEGTITVKIAEITFVLKDGETTKPVDETVLKKKDPTFGTEAKDIVDVSKLTAQFDGKEDEADTNFTVKFKAGDKEDTKPVAAGKNTVTILYSGNVGGLEWNNIPVWTGEVDVQKSAAKIKSEPASADNIANGTEQSLVTGGEAEGGTILYSHYENGEYKPTITGTQAAGYKVWYYVKGDENHSDSEKTYIVAAILPKLTAVYGNTLKEIESQLPTGFTWSKDNPEGNTVGNAGTGSVKVDYTPTDTANYHSLTDKTIPIEVSAKEAVPVVTVAGHVAHTGEKIENKPTSVKVGIETLRENDDYTLSWDKNKDPGRAEVTITANPNGNYDFAPITENFIIYDSVGEVLTDSVPVSPEVTKTVAEIKSELDAKIPEGYSARKYYNFAMKDKDSNYTYEEFYWPDGGLPFTLIYPTGMNSDDDFVAYAMYTVTSEDGSPTAGEIVEIDVDKVETGEKKEKRLKIKLDTYAAVCLAYKATYNVTVDDTTNGTVKFTVGSSTTKVESASVKEGETVTIYATPKSGYVVSKVQYTYKDGSTTKGVTINEKDDKYSFTMPNKSKLSVDDVEIRVTFAKSSSVNPRTGDSSHIQFWTGTMCFSALAAAALVLGRKKRYSK